MTADLASLAIKVDSTQARLAALELNKLENAGRSLELGNSRLTNSFGGLKTAIGGVASAIGAYQIAQFAKDAAMASARFETMGVVMHRVGENAGYSASEMDKYDLALRNTGISMNESRLNVTRFVQAQLDLAKASDLARVAQDAAVIGNINSSEAFGRVVRGIQTGEQEILKTIGLTVQWEAGYEKLASQLGKTRKELTETEKSSARLNTVLDAGLGIAGVYEDAMDTVGKQLLSLKRYHDDLKTVAGEAFGPSTQVFVQQYTKLLKQLQKDLLEAKDSGALDVFSQDMMNHGLDGLLMLIKATGVLHNSLDGLHVVVLTIDNVFIELASTGMKLVETFVKPLDLIFDGLVKIGAIDANPFDEFQQAAAGTQNEIAKTRAEIVDAMVERDEAYDKLHKKVKAFQEDVNKGLNEQLELQKELKESYGEESYDADYGAPADEIEKVSQVLPKYTREVERLNKALRSAATDTLPEYQQGIAKINNEFDDFREMATDAAFAANWDLDEYEAKLEEVDALNKKALEKYKADKEAAAKVDADAATTALNEAMGNAALSRMSKYDRQLAQINKTYDEMIDLATAAAFANDWELDDYEIKLAQIETLRQGSLADAKKDHEEAAGEITTVYDSFFDGLDKGMDEWVRSGEISINSYVDTFSAGIRQMVVDYTKGMASMQFDGTGGFSSAQMSQIGSQAGIAATIMGGTSAGYAATGVTVLNEFLDPGTYEYAMYGLQDKIAMTVYDGFSEGVGEAIGNMSNASFGGWTTGITRTATSLLSGEDLGESVARGVTSGVSYAVGTALAGGNPIGGMILSTITDFAFGAIFGDDEPRSTRYAEVAEYDYNPITGAVTTIDSYSPHISGYDARGTEISGSEFSATVSASLTAMVASMEALGEAAGLSEQAIRSGFDSVTSVHASTDDRKYFDDPVSTGQNLATSYYHRLKGDDVEEDFNAYWEQNMAGAMEGLFAPFVDAFTDMIGDGDLDLSNFSAEAAELLQQTFDDAVALIEIDPENDIEAGMAEVETGMNTLASVYSYIGQAADIIDAIDESVRLEGLSEYALEIESINNKYDEWATLLSSLGIDVDKTSLEVARSIELNEANAQQAKTIAGVIDSLTLSDIALEVKGINDEFDGFVDTLTEAGASAEDFAIVEKKRTEEINSAYERQTQSITDIIDDLTLTDLGKEVKGINDKFDDLAATIKDNPLHSVISYFTGQPYTDDDLNDLVEDKRGEELAAAYEKYAEGMEALTDSWQSLLDRNTLGDVALEIQELTYWFEEQKVAIAGFVADGVAGANDLADLLVEPLQAAWDAIVDGLTEPWQTTIDTAGLDEAGKAIYELQAWLDEQEEAIAAIAATEADEDIDALHDTLGTAIRIMWDDLLAEFTDPWTEIAETAGLSETALAVRDLNTWHAEQKEILASLIATSPGSEIADKLTGDLDSAYNAQLQALRDSLTEPWTEIIETAGINDMAQAMYDLNAWFDLQAASAKELGLSIDDLTAAFDAQLGVLREQLTDPWQTIVDTAGMDDEQKEIYELNKWYDTEKERALALGLDTTLLDQAYNILYDGITDVFGKAVEEYKDQLDGLNDALDTVRNTIDAIGNTSDSIKYSSLNVALPTEIFSEADKDYDSLFADAKTGDADAVQDYLDFTSTYLGYAQDIYKSSQDYIDIYNDVMGDIGGLLTDQETEESRIVDAIGTMTTAIEKIEEAIVNQEISITVNVIDEDGNEVPVDISKQTTEGGKRNVTVQLAAA